ncbi:MAG: mandelate racemase/muconate lactonizing enzyme family protein [Chloroflexi bacterium]|nr:mandelate racemase/muconate lactonizing enzyme family protein [Chloroflexota bacterium]MBV9543764.1 mandelate racemase/muconate lactonizing enzyme family protein [Chloroflexota bacterium]
MKISKITPFLVDRCLLVRVYTDSGIVGTGEAGLWAHHHLVLDAINELSEYYVGKDASRMEHHFQVVSRDTHFQGAVLSAAMSAIDIALWDILGKSVDKPVHALLGGRVRERVKVFANVIGKTPDEMARSAESSVQKGYTSLRVIPFFEGFECLPSTQVIGRAVDVVHVIREAIGYEVDLGVEIHRNLSKVEIVQFGNLVAPYRLLYVEDPLAPESTDSLRYVAEHVNVPLAAGERAYNMYQFKEIIDTGAVALVRPDLSLAGGFTQVKKIAAVAESAFVGIFPHLMGSPVNLAAYVQLDAAIPNYVLMEDLASGDALNEILEEPLRRDGGYVVVPDRPGIGVDIREDRLARFPYRPHTISGWFREDGSVAH